ncbi:hypothetical protein MYVALT_G_02670 [Candidatus Vallotia tarda]|uniref:Uncharacterized protein n=1 Tax=Candidatus Vallotiella hemipterorum TaxID=1177213 RepID=A0A916JSX6_9BURK|nr:hypothetical protein MYVALT_G_02670 [Candidatus Vallotia tarda]
MQHAIHNPPKPTRSILADVQCRKLDVKLFMIKISVTGLSLTTSNSPVGGIPAPRNDMRVQLAAFTPRRAAGLVYEIE